MTLLGDMPGVSEQHPDSSLLSHPRSKSQSVNWGHVLLEVLSEHQRREFMGKPWMGDGGQGRLLEEVMQDYFEVQ